MATGAGSSLVVTSIVVAALAIPGSAHANDPLFGSLGRVVEMSSAPQSVVVGDFDSDAVPDLAAAFVLDTRVLVFQGVGDGTFGSPTALQVGETSKTLIVADFNSDGHLDLAATHNSGSTVTILFGTGTGEFPSSIDIPADAYPDGIAAADLNGDGSLDLAVPCFYAVVVLYNYDAGTRWVRGTLLSATFQSSVALGDLDADGDNDVVVGSTGSYNGYSFGITVFRNLGPDQFSSGSVTYLDHSSAALAIADMTGDGIADVLTPNQMLPGLGGGTFGVPTSFASYNGSPALDTRDVDGDSLLDVVTLSAGNGAIYRGQAGGTFSSPLYVSTGDNPTALATGDVDSDGDMDLVTANRYGASASVLLGNGDGTFGTMSYVHAPGGAGLLSHADMNLDGWQDIVAIGSATGANTIQVLLSQTGGSFAPPVSTVLPSYLLDYAVGDLTEDGVPDVVVSLDDSIAVLSGDGHGAFVVGPRVYAGHTATGIALGDVNRDGRLDVAACLYGDTYCDYDFDCYDVFTDSAAVLLAMGDGSFSRTPAVHTAESPYDVELADVNADGWLDLLTLDTGRWRNSAWRGGDSLSVFLGRGAGLFGGRHGFFAGHHPWRMDVGDVTGDGLLDVVTAIQGTSYGGDDPLGEAGVGTMIGLGNGAFLPPIREPSGTACEDVAITRLDGDEVADIVASFGPSSSLRVLRGRHNAPPALADFFATMRWPQSFTVIDADHDGRLDIVVPAVASDSLAIHHNLGVLPLAVPPGTNTSLGVRLLARSARGAFALRVEVDVPTVVSSFIVDTAGRRVAQVAERLMVVDEQELTWGGRMDDGSRAPAGVYLWTITSERGALSSRVVVMR